MFSPYFASYRTLVKTRSFAKAQDDTQLRRPLRLCQAERRTV
jgi:hypothetical protein